MSVICKTITATTPATPANITALLISDPVPSTGNAPLNASIMVRWHNTGGTAGTFQPKITVGGTIITTAMTSETIPANSNGGLHPFYFTVSSAGTVTICPVPN